LVGVWTRGDWFALNDFGAPFSLHEHVDADAGEAAAYLTGRRFNIVAGGSILSSRDEERPIVADMPLPIATDKMNDHAFWLYGTSIPAPGLQLTLGGSFDQLRTIVNRTEFGPKLGVSWDVLSNTTLRAAWFANLKRPLIGDPSLRSGQTIEPTQVAGFNQLFDDPTGAKTRRWGVGIDQKFPNPFFASDTLLFGAEWSQRQLTVPIGVIDQVLEQGWKERYGRTYLSWLPSERLAFNAEVDYEALHRTELAASIDGFSNIQLLRVPIELRYFDPNGLLGLVRTTVVREQGQFFDLASAEVMPGKGTFGTVDLGVGWRYPGRPFITTFEVQNLLDAHFHFQDTDPLNPRIFARRTFLVRMTARL